MKSDIMGVQYHITAEVMEGEKITEVGQWQTKS